MSLDRILAHVTKEENGCWLWIGAMDKTAPMLRVSQPTRKLVSARRYAYEVHNQVCVPSSFVITAICKKSRCVNPAHLTAQKRGMQGHRLIGSWKFEHCQNGHEFSVWNTGHQNSGKRFCIACDKIHAKQYMAEQRRENPGHLMEIRLKRSDERREWVRQQKTACIMCGESNPLVLDFNHRDPTTKLFSISSEAGNYSKAKLQAEMAKCDLLCANCHRIYHHANAPSIVRTRQRISEKVN